MRGGRGAPFFSQKEKFCWHFLPLTRKNLDRKVGEKHFMEVNQKELAEILGLTDRRIRQLIKDFGLFSAFEAGGKRQKRYNLEKCVQEYISYKVSEETGMGTSQTKEEEQTRHEEIKIKITVRRTEYECCICRLQTRTYRCHL